MKIHILGAEWTISTSRKKDDEEFSIGCADGWSDYTKRKIVVMDKEDYPPQTDKDKYYNQILRHELIHAFLNESGLVSGSCDWHCEEMVDWLAIQSPKIFEVFKNLDLI